MNRTRIFWTCILPEQLIGQYKLSFAACNFSFNLISGGGFDHVYSMMPLFVGGEMDPRAFTDNRFELIYDNLRKRRGFWQKLAALKEQWTIFRKIPRRASIWFYNLNTLNALLFVLLRTFKPSVQLNIIVLDFTPVTQGWGLNRIYLKLINAAHGRICLASSPLFNRKNATILPGVIPAVQGYYPKIETPQKKFLLSGVLSEEIAQLSLILQVFAQLPAHELYITGYNGDEQKLKEYSSKYKNIHWYGQLPYSEYIDLLHDITFQLSTRDPVSPENQCNFPSKIIEALLHNRIIISTIHYPQLNGINYFEIASEGEAFIKKIQAITSMDVLDLLVYANQSDSIKKAYNTGIWNTTMNDIEQNRR